MRISSKFKIAGKGTPVEWNAMQWSKYLDLLEAGLGQKVLGRFDGVEG